MEILAKSADRNLLLELSGELDHHGARTALREMEEALDAALPRKLVLDLSGVTFMDSSGIAVILRARQKMQLLDGGLLVRGGAAPGPAGAGGRRGEPAGDDQIRRFYIHEDQGSQ